MRAASILLLTLASACASGPSSAGSGPIRSQGTIGTAFDARSNTLVQSIAYPMDQVWRALPAVYDSLKIPLNTLDTKSHTIGNDGFKIRQRLGTVNLSKYIECGTTQIGPNADSYDIVLTVVTQLQTGDGGATKVTTTFESSAKPIAFAQEYSKCSSKGVLEPRIMDLLRARLMR